MPRHRISVRVKDGSDSITLYFDSSLEFVVFVNYLLTQLTTYFEVIIINQ